MSWEYRVYREKLVVMETMGAGVKCATDCRTGQVIDQFVQFWNEPWHNPIWFHGLVSWLVGL